MPRKAVLQGDFCRSLLAGVFLTSAIVSVVFNFCVLSPVFFLLAATARTSREPIGMSHGESDGDSDGYADDIQDAVSKFLQDGFEEESDEDIEDAEQLHSASSTSLYSFAITYLLIGTSGNHRGTILFCSP